MTEEVFKTLVLPLKAKLFRLAVALLGNRPEAEDTVQEVYLKLWNRRHKLAEYDSLEALAVTIAKNNCIDKLRSYRSRNKNEQGIEELMMPGDGRHNPLQRVEMKESLRQIYDVIRQLPDQQRLILHLRDFEQYRYDEIEKITGMSRNNIRVTLSRARKKVRETYLKEATL